MFTKPQTFNVVLVVVAILGAFVILGAERLGIHISPGFTALAYAAIAATCGYCESYAKKQESLLDVSTPLLPSSTNNYILSYVKVLEDKVKSLLPVISPSIEPFVAAVETTANQELSKKLENLGATLKINQNELLAALLTKAESSVVGVLVPTPNETIALKSEPIVYVGGGLSPTK